MGNIHDADFMTIWNSEQAARVRDKGTQMPEELLDGWHGKSCDAQIYKVSAEVGIEEQTTFNARQTCLLRL